MPVWDKYATLKPPPCQTCGDTAKMRHGIITSGIHRYFWWCLACEHFAETNGPAIRYGDVQALCQRYGYKREDIPIATVAGVPMDYRDGQFCEICGVNGAEFHHLTPTALADLMDSVMTGTVPGEVRQKGVFLCKTHHDLWHEAVTWYMPGRGNTPAAEAVIRAHSPNIIRTLKRLGIIPT